MPAEVYEIESLHDLPRNVPLKLYEPPWMSDNVIEEVTQQFERKTGHPPTEIYRYKKQIFVR